MRLIFLGPPGAGKGTQSSRISAHLGLAHIATGDILREAVSSGSALGNKVGEFMDRGELAPDDVLNEVVEERLKQEDTVAGFVLDGYPRNLEQASALEEMLAPSGLDSVVKLMVTGDEIADRLAGRGRTDDTREAIMVRLDAYGQQTKPLYELYEEEGLLREVDGIGTADEVFHRILEAIGR